MVAVTAEMVHARLPSLRTYGVAAGHYRHRGLSSILSSGRFRLRVDRMFDRRRFDYRETLVDFGRGLNSQTDLRTLLDSIVEQLPKALLVTRVAVFLAAEGETHHHTGKQFDLAASTASPTSPVELKSLDIGFLDFDGPESYNHLFLENPQQVLRLPELQQLASCPARPELHMFPAGWPIVKAQERAPSPSSASAVPPTVTFSSAKRWRVLESLAGYIGIAIQNAQLYRRLQQKITDFERLKEFNENIVESINIGILAVDLDDRVESWNAQMEVLFARPRAGALRQPISELFPADFVARFG